MENIKNIPENIYLQVDSDGDDSEIQFNDLAGVTWCVDRINDTDLKFQLNQTENELFTKEDVIAFALYNPSYGSMVEKENHLKKCFNTWVLHRKYYGEFEI